MGRGPKSRLVPTINDVDTLPNWWLVDVRHQFGDDYNDPDAPLLRSERHDPHTGWCGRICDQALRDGLAGAVGRWLPAWSGRLTRHTLRHYCASSLYGRGVDLKAIQELLGHEWLSTTTRYVHVNANHVEAAWRKADERVGARLDPLAVRRPRQERHRSWPRTARTRGSDMFGVSVATACRLADFVPCARAAEPAGE